MPRPGCRPPPGESEGANGSSSVLPIDGANNSSFLSSSSAFEEAVNAALSACRTNLQESAERELRILRDTLIHGTTSGVNGTHTVAVNGVDHAMGTESLIPVPRVEFSSIPAQEVRIFDTTQTTASELETLQEVLREERKILQDQAQMRQDIAAKGAVPTTATVEPIDEDEQPKKCLSCDGHGCSLCMKEKEDEEADRKTQVIAGTVLKILRDEIPGARKSTHAVTFDATTPLQKFVRGQKFEMLCTLVILVNTIAMGISVDIQVQHAVSHKGTKAPTSLAWFGLEWFFMIFYTLEVAVKLAAYKIHFFTIPEWKWNVFDFILVLVSWIGVVLPGNLLNPMFLRIARIFKQVAKAMRVINVVQFFSELRVILAAFAGSFMTFMWAMASLAIILYVFCIILLDGVAVMLQEYVPGNIEERIIDAAEDQWGSLWRAMITLSQSITGGRPWYMAIEPIEKAGMFYFLIFLLYISFLAIAMLRLLTGLFVSKANQAAAKDHEEAVWSGMRLLFEQVDIDHSGSISKEEFMAHLSSKEAVAVLKMLNIDKQNAFTLFELLDSSGDEKVDIDEFISGCAHYGGPARNIELALVNCKISDLYRQVALLIDYLEASTQVILKAMERDLKRRAQKIHSCKRIQTTLFDM